MAESRENSVLHSLKELRRIEDDRVRLEEEESKRKAEAERAAKVAGEQRAKEEEARKRKEEEDQLRKIETDKVSKAREEQLRLEEAERRARIEGEMKLQEERMRLEVAAKSHHKSPVKAVVTVAAVLVVVGAVGGYILYSNHQAEMAKAVQERAALEEEAKAREAEFKGQMAAIQKKVEDSMKGAKTEAERQAILQAAADEKRDAENRRQAAHRKTGGGGRPSTPAAKQDNKDKSDSMGPAIVPKKQRMKVSEDPLDGLKL